MKWYNFSSQLLITTLLISGLPVKAQTEIPSCQPPGVDQFILLVRETSRTDQEQLKRTLPQGVEISLCNYSNQEVIRLGNFSDIETADNWGSYIREITGLVTVIAASSQERETSLEFNPRPLDSGYGVLVNYFNETEVAVELRDLLNKEIGLVSYLARPYLLVLHTKSEREASQLLERLSQRGFWAVVVQSDRATLLTPVVSY